MAQMTDAEVEVGVALNWAEQGGPLVVSDIAARGNGSTTEHAVDESDRRLRELGYRPEFRVGL